MREQKSPALMRRELEVDRRSAARLMKRAQLKLELLRKQKERIALVSKLSELDTKISKITHEFARLEAMDLKLIPNESAKQPESSPPENPDESGKQVTFRI